MLYKPHSVAQPSEFDPYIESELIKDYDDKNVTVIVTGFPQKTNKIEVEEFMLNISDGNKFDVKVDSKNYFRGFVYVKFQLLEEAEKFINKEYVFQKKLLNCRISMQYYQFINESIDNLRSPKKVFADRIPKHWSKKEVEKFFDQYGEVDYLSLVDKDHKTVNFAYVTFVESESACNCVKNKLIKLKDKRKIKVEYSNPKFSANMLNKIHPVLRRYIESVQNGAKVYDPKDFIYLQDIVLANENLFVNQNTANAMLGEDQKMPMKSPYMQNFSPTTSKDEIADNKYTDSNMLAYDMSRLNLHDYCNNYQYQEGQSEFAKVDGNANGEYLHSGVNNVNQIYERSDNQNYYYDTNYDNKDQGAQYNAQAYYNGEPNYAVENTQCDTSPYNYSYQKEPLVNNGENKEFSPSAKQNFSDGYSNCYQNQSYDAYYNEYYNRDYNYYNGDQYCQAQYPNDTPTPNDYYGQTNYHQNGVTSGNDSDYKSYEQNYQS